MITKWSGVNCFPNYNRLQRHKLKEFEDTIVFNIFIGNATCQSSNWPFNVSTEYVCVLGTTL